MADPIPLWRQIQRENFISLKKLCAFLELDDEQIKSVADNKNFPLNLPRRLAEKIAKNDLNDPIFRQFVPLVEELKQKENFVKDPVGDSLVTITSKCLQKYQGRVLLLASSACAMHCRFCFRQNFDYDREQKGLSKEIDLIKKDTTVKEVILSGGDPLSLKNEELGVVFNALEDIDHVRRIRFHTRFPIGIPERIDDDLLKIFEKSRLQIWFLIHSNHPRELDDDVIAALKKITRLGIPVLNQWVLLKGVNDRVEVQQELCEKLADNGLIPYYLHQLDRVEGASHFEVSIDQGKKLIKELTERMSGYAVPKYVQEVSGEASKSLIF